MSVLKKPIKTGRLTFEVRYCVEYNRDGGENQHHAKISKNHLLVKKSKKIKAKIKNLTKVDKNCVLLLLKGICSDNFPLLQIFSALPTRDG